MKRAISANQIFVGYQWRTHKAVWDNLVNAIQKRYPLHFLAIGREIGQPASQLLVKILHALNRSSYAFFDASGGNANVSLEYGYARAIMDDPAVYLFLDEDSPTATGGNAAIISDLAGTVANRYRMSDSRLSDTVAQIVKRHPYNRRFDRFCRQRGYKGGTRKFLLRIIRQLDDTESVLRRELLDNLMHESGKSEEYIVRYLKELNQAGLVTVTKGNHYSSRVSVSS